MIVHGSNPDMDIKFLYFDKISDKYVYDKFV